MKRFSVGATTLLVATSLVAALASAQDKLSAGLTGVT
jgi:hypothetical protein